MKFVIVDGDREALEYTARSLKRVYKQADIVTFADALSTYQYCVNHAREIALVFLPVTLKPIDGFKLRELISAYPIPLGIVFTMRGKSEDLIELINTNGNERYIVKPVTPSKISALAKEMVEQCWTDEDECKSCAYFWCRKRKGEADA